MGGKKYPKDSGSKQGQNPHGDNQQGSGNQQRPNQQQQQQRPRDNRPNQPRSNIDQSNIARQMPQVSISSAGPSSGQAPRGAWGQSAQTGQQKPQKQSAEQGAQQQARGQQAQKGQQNIRAQPSRDGQQQRSAAQPSQGEQQKSGQGQLQRTTSQQSVASTSSRQSDKKMPVKDVPTNMPHLLCKYKGPGTKGRKLGPIETNYLKIIMDKMVSKAYHYDVKIDPERPRKYLHKIFQKFCEINFPNIGIAFDGEHNAYSPIILDLTNVRQEFEFINPETGGARNCTVKIEPTDTTEIDLIPLREYRTTRQYDMPRRALQCVEIILKGAFQQAHLANGLQTKRSFFPPQPDRREYLGDFFELWLGLFQSTVLGYNPYLNVDIIHKAFPKRYESLARLYEDIQRESRNDPIRALKSHLSGLDVIYTTPGNAGARRIYKFMDVLDTPDKVFFNDENGQRMSIAQYFTQKNYRINNPRLPCVKIGSAIRSISVPMEHCALSDRQAINKKCTENQTRNIIRFAATSTDVRKQKIVDVLNTVRHNSSAVIQGFGLALNTDFAKVEARQLNAPIIQYANSKTQTVKNGVWRGEGMPFLVPESANTWAILNCNNRTRNNELQDLARMLKRVSGPTNLNLAEMPAYTHNVDDRNERAIRAEMDLAKKEKVRILFCVIPDSGPAYAKVKQIAELQVGVLTQCIKGGTVFKKRNDGSTISNILLKVNAKLNGQNHRLNDSTILRDNCMVIGADVTHPSPDQRDIPSVVGVAASHDKDAFCYNACWRLQGPRVEIIEDFRNIIKEHLKFYKEKNKCLPKKILYYRDGVSEGQFQQVMATERQGIAAACRDIQPGYDKEVKLTIIVVQKRHHTRFFPGQTPVGRDDRRNNNVPAGTIVDTEIVHPNENHFYLVSHQSIQGVAKPTKYCILLDEGNHSIDDIQALSYNLCHLFSRCNRSVSYPAPTYYAHLAAYRGRVYIEGPRLRLHDLQREWQSRAIKENIVHGHPMFFV